MTRPMLGWAALSRNALNRAKAQLTADAEGVRDEVGVLTLHFGDANRFVAVFAASRRGHKAPHRGPNPYGGYCR